MGNFNGKFESAKQEWTTPDDLYDKLNEIYSFNIDLAADNSNKKCNNYFSEEDDSLEQIWVGRGWLNPPYGGRAKNKLSNWIKKAKEEVDCGHADLVAVLLPARTNTVWWKKYCMTASTIYFICGRPKFGNARYGLPQPLAIVVFDKGCDGNTKFLTFEV